MAHEGRGSTSKGPEAPESVAVHLTARHNGMSGMRRIPVRVKRKQWDGLLLTSPASTCQNGE
jgi:hypothetical protein